MKYTSINTVISKIVRDIGTDVNYPFSDIKEWISEIAEALKAKPVLNIGFADYTVSNHRTKLPCPAESIVAVVHEGCRLRVGGDIRDYRKLEPPKADPVTTEILDSLWVPEVEVRRKFDEDGNLIESVYGTNRLVTTTGTSTGTLTKLKLRNLSEEYYKIQGQWLQTSFEEGEITLHYLTMARDDDGYLMIPDYYAVREAIYYHVLFKLIGRGLKHPMSYVDALSLHDKYMAKALAVINFPDINEFETIINRNSKLMPDIDPYSDFYLNTEQFVNYSADTRYYIPGDRLNLNYGV